jgi:C1A family cysteine protease
MTVRDSRRPDFWNGTKYEGMHGVAIIGWNDKGFIIKNSWGEDFGNNGTTILPHERFNELQEIWTVIA